MSENKELSLSLPVETKRKRVNPKIWRDVEADYKSGQFEITNLCAKYEIKRTTVEKHLKVNNIIKGAESLLIQGNIAEQNRKRFIRAGITPQRAIELITEGMSKPEKVVFEGKGENMLATTQPDYALRLNYLQEYNKLCSNYGSPEKEEKHLHLHLDSEKVEKMDAIEAIKEYQKFDQ